MSQCNTFQPECKIPDFEKLSAEVKTHDELHYQLSSNFDKNMDKYKPPKTDITSSLGVVFPNEKWVHINKPDQSSRHFIIFPRKGKNIPVIKIKWQNPKLFAKLDKLIMKEQLLLACWPLAKNKSCLLDYQLLLPYLMVNDETIAKHKFLSTNIRHQALESIPNCKLQWQKGGLKSLFKNQPKDSKWAYLVHLQLDSDYNLCLWHKKQQNLHKCVSQSNFFLWLVVEVTVDNQSMVSESLLLMNDYTWLSYTNKAYKHEDSIASAYNLDESKETSTTLNSTDKRKSNVTPNDVLEMDALLKQYLQYRVGFKCKIESQTVQYSPVYAVANYYYSMYNNSLLTQSQSGFIDLFVHYQDINRPWAERYKRMKYDYVSMFEFMQVSQKNINTAIIPDSNIRIGLCSCLDELGQTLDEKCKHYWLPKQLNYSYKPKQAVESIKQYMNNLMIDFPLNDLSKEPQVLNFINLMHQLMPKHLANVWCLSIYNILGSRGVYNLRRVKSCGKRISFDKGYEVIIILNDCFNGQVQQQPVPFYVNVQNCAVACHSPVTVLQLGQAREKFVSVIGASTNVYLCVLRRIPTVLT